jgi:hypothetical protein
MKIAAIVQFGNETRTIVGDIDENDIIRGVDLTQEDENRKILIVGEYIQLKKGLTMTINKDHLIAMTFFYDPQPQPEIQQEE